MLSAERECDWLPVQALRRRLMRPAARRHPLQKADALHRADRASDAGFRQTDRFDRGKRPPVQHERQAEPLRSRPEAGDKTRKLQAGVAVTTASERRREPVLYIVWQA